MIDLKTFFPNVVLTGEGILDQVANWISHLKGKNILIVTDSNVGKLDFVKNLEVIIEKSGFNLLIWDKVIPNPDLLTVRQGLACLDENNCDLIIGIGGGSVLDTAKAISVVATNGKVVENCLGLFNIKNRGLPLILIPTTSGTGSEVTHISVLVDEKTNQKVAIYSEFNMADVVIIDYELTYDLPPMITADTGIDALAHAIEAFVSKNSSDFTDLMAISAIEKIGKHISRAYLYGNKDKEARKEMALGSLYAGMSFCGAGLGGAHGLAYPLIEYNLSHGRSVGVFLCWVMRYNLSYARHKLSRIAKVLDKSLSGKSEEELAEKSIELVKEILQALDISYRLRDYGVKLENLDDMAKSAFESTERLLKFNPRKISLEDARAIYREAF